MHRPRPIHTILSLLVALGLVLAPLTSHAGGPRASGKQAAKPLPQRTQKVAKEALQGASKAEKTKALTNLSKAMAARTDKGKALRMSTTKQASFLKSSVRGQRAGQPTSTTTARARKATQTRKNTKKKNNRKNTSKKTNKRNSGGGADDEALDEGLDDGDVDAEDGDIDGDEELDADEVQEIIDNADFDEENLSEAFDALEAAEALEANGDELGSLEQEAFYHDMMAYEAELAAQDYEDAGRPEQAETLRVFSRQSKRDATTLKTRYLKLIKQQNSSSQAPQQERVEPATGFFGKMKANRAARKIFRQRIKADATGQLASRYGTLNRQQRSALSLIGTGASIVFGVKSALAVVAGTAGVGTFIVGGLAAFGLYRAGSREIKVRAASRKQMARELQASGQLTQAEIETYQAAGWI